VVTNVSEESAASIFSVGMLVTTYATVQYHNSEDHNEMSYWLPHWMDFVFSFVGDDTILMWAGGLVFFRSWLSLCSGPYNSEGLILNSRRSIDGILHVMLLGL
jgi:hypothetical protein